MSLEQALIDHAEALAANTKAINTLVVALGKPVTITEGSEKTAPPAKAEEEKKKAAAKTEKKEKAKAKKQKEEIEYSQIASLVVELVDLNHKDKAVSILGLLEAKKASDLKPAQYQQAFEMLSHALTKIKREEGIDEVEEESAEDDEDLVSEDENTEEDDSLV